MTRPTSTLPELYWWRENPQWQFNYRELWKPVPYAKYEELREKLGDDYDFRVWNEKGEPQYRSYVPGEELPIGWSIMPFFPNYVWTGAKSYWCTDILDADRCRTNPEYLYELLDRQKELDKTSRVIHRITSFLSKKSVKVVTSIRSLACMAR